MAAWAEQCQPVPATVVTLAERRTVPG